MSEVAPLNPTAQSEKRRKIEAGLVVLASAVVAIMVPGIILNALGVPHAGVVGMTGLATMISTAMLGWRAGAIGALTLTVGLVIADAAAHFWITAVIVMVVVSVAYGLTALRGWQWGFMLTAILFAAVIVNPPTRDLTLTHPVTLLDLAVVTAATTAFGVAAVTLITKGRALSKEVPIGPERAYPYAAMLGIAALITTSIALQGSFKGGAALMMTPIIVLEPFLKHGMIVRIFDRGWGVVAGSLLAIGLSVAIAQDWGVFVAGAVAAAVALFAKMAKWEYRHYVAALTTAVVLFSGPQATILADGRDRMVATLLGIAIAAVLAALSIPLLRRARQEESRGVSASSVAS